MKLTIKVADSSKGLGTKPSFLKSWIAAGYLVISQKSGMADISQPFSKNQDFNRKGVRGI